MATLACAVASLVPVSVAHAQVVCPAAAVGETLNIVATGGVTTCTNIGTAKATSGIEIYNGLVGDVHPTAYGSRFGVAFRKVTTSGNEQPTAVGCVNDCANLQPGDSFDEDQPGTSSNGVVADWGYGTGTVTLAQCLAWSRSSSQERGCTISFQFADGTTGSFSVPVQSNVIPSFSLGGAVALPPTITSVSPSSGFRGANTQVTITGTGFTNVSRVRFAQYLDAASFQVVSSTEIRAVTPALNTPLTRWLEVLTDHGIASGEHFTFAPNLVVTTESLPTATRGASYHSAPLTAVGGIFAQTFGATGLPAGLALNASTGVISGTPTQSGSFPVAVTVTEHSTANYGGPFTSAPKQIALVVATPPAVSVTSLNFPGGVYGASYSVPLNAAGGVGPYAFSTSGLPPGLAVVGNAITGTPTQPGTFLFSLSATDSTPPASGGPITSATNALVLSIAKAPQILTFTSIPVDTLSGTYYTPTVTSSGASGNPIRIEKLYFNDPACLLLANGLFLFNAPGTCNIHAEQSGNANFEQGRADQILVMGVVTQSQAITFTSTPPASPSPGSTYTVTATGGGSGKPVTFTIDAASTSGACMIAGATVTFTGGGTCIVNANQAAAHDNTYFSAPQVQQTIIVARVAQTLTFTKPANVTFGSGDVVLAASASSGLPVGFASTTPGVCTVVDGKARLVGVGACSLTASQPGNMSYLPAADVVQAFSVEQATQTVVFATNPPPPTSALTGTVYTFSASGGGSGNPVTFSLDPASTAGACTISGARVSFDAPGTCLVNANQADSTNYLAAAQVQHSITVGKANQTIAFTSTVPASPAVGGTYAVTATGGASGLPVTFAIDAASAAGACSIAGATVSFNGAGACLINANQAGNANYNAASQVQQALTVGKASQTIAFTSVVPANPKVGGTYAVTATGGASSNAVTFTIDAASTAGACTIAGGTVSFAGAGTCHINANQAGNANFLAAAQVQQTVVIAKSGQTITFTKPADAAFGAGPVTLVATATSGLAVTFASTTTGVCTVSGAIATVIGTGTCSITASQAGNATWLAAAHVAQSFSVGKAAQAITFTKPADILFAAGTTVSLSASATSGLAVTFASTTTSVCTVSGATATLVSAGSCTVVASQVGNANYLPAPDVTQTFNSLGAPNISATATVSPPTFSQPGTMLTFTFTLTNSGNVAATNVSLADARLGAIPCAATTIVAAGSVSCTGSTATTAADIAVRSISIRPQLTYSYGAPTTAAASFRAAAATGGGSGSVTVTIALNVTVTATVDVAAVQQATRSAIQGLLASNANTLTTTGPDASRMHARLSGGTLFGSANSAAGFVGDVDEAAMGRPTIGRRMAGIGGSSLIGGGGSAFGFGGPSGGGSPFDRFMRSGDSITEGAGDIAGWSRWPGGLPFGAGPAYEQSRETARNLGWRFTGNAGDTAGRFSFSTSLSQLRAAAAQDEQARRASATDVMGIGGTTSVAKSTPRPALVDVWIEGSAAYLRNERHDESRKGHTAIVLAGVDYLVRPGLLVGLMAQMDWISDSATGALAQARAGRGWMAGPYVSARLTPNLYFDARALWGRSSNTIDPLGAYTDRFDTTRSLVAAKLTGDWAYGDLRLRPSAELLWFSETAESYTNAIAIDIAGQTYSLGRLAVGPEIAYRVRFADGATFEPFLGVKALWDFARTQEVSAAGAPIDPGNLRARLEAGATLRTSAGISLRATGSYDGIGASGYHAVQGKAQVVVPLQ